MDLESLDILIVDNTTDAAIIAIGDEHVTITHHQDHYLCDCDTKVPD